GIRERFHKTALNEFYRVAFRKKVYRSIDELRADLDAWIQEYNETSTFYDWYSRYQEGGIEALVDGKPRPRRIWNKIPDKIETAIVNLALEEPDLSPRELAVNFTDTKGSFVSEATVYRLLKDHGLITSPAFILMKAADRFANPTTAPNQLW